MFSMCHYLAVLLPVLVTAQEKRAHDHSPNYQISLLFLWPLIAIIREYM